MVTKTFDFETPDFGDWSKGSHTVSHDREVYQRTYVESPDFEILVERLRSGPNDLIFKFVIDFPLERQSANFDEDLLFALNLLQENVGAADILPRDAKSLSGEFRLDCRVF